MSLTVAVDAYGTELNMGDVIKYINGQELYVVYESAGDVNMTILRRSKDGQMVSARGEDLINYYPLKKTW